MAILPCLLGLLLTSILAQPTTVNICVPYPVDDVVLEQCTEAAGLANTDDLTFVCVEGGTPDDCIGQLVEGDAHLTTLDGSDILRAHSDHGLQPIIAEETGNDVPGGTYYAVAVVNKEFCNEETTLADLMGTRSCHTGYRKSAGWKIPVGTLLTEVEDFQTAGMDGIVEDDAEAVARFFDTVCAPRVSDNGPINTDDGKGALWDQLCSGCKGDCTAKDQYYDYSGAFRCLMEDQGDVAFVKHTTVLDYAADGNLDPVLHAWATKNASDFQLLCQDGCADVEDYEYCHLALAPGHAMVTTVELGYDGEDEEMGMTIQSAILDAAKDGQFLNDTVGLTSNFVWSEDTVGLKALEMGMDSYISTVSLDTFLAFETLAKENRNAIPPTAIYCASSEEEFEFCDKMVEAAVEVAPDFVWDCVQENTTEDCIRAISRGEADWMTVSPRDAYFAFVRYDLAVIASEEGSLGDGADYYSVAVVKQKFCEDNENARLLDLKGKRSCHTGFRRNAGWDIPVGRMLTIGIMDPVRNNSEIENDAETVAAFFEASCAPNSEGEGPRTTRNGLKRSWPPLCSACEDSCDEKSSYYGYEGAHRCLKDDAGDVAFIKHTTPFDFDNEKERADLRLLCPTRRGCADLDEYEDCNLGLVPARAVIVQNTPMYTLKFKDTLVNISTQATFADLVLNESGNPNGYVFRPTGGLIPLDDSIRVYLGLSFQSYSALEKLEAPEDVTVNICIPYGATDSDIADCDELFQSANITGVILKCVRGGSPAICMEQLHRGEAHLTTLDGGDVFRAHHVYGIVPLIREIDEDDEEGQYYAVAVVNADFCGDKTTLADLEGTRSCHTGYRKMAGWRVPVGTLLSEVEAFNTKRNKATIEDDAELMASFFDTVCAPRVSGNGPINTDDGKGASWDQLCSGCKGDCSIKDQYYDYSGALRCLMEDQGDVAFVKHTTVLDYAADGNLDPVLHAWATKNASDFQLLCLDGGCADVEDYEDCHLALVPSHAIVGAAALGERGALAYLGTVIQNGLIAATENPEFFDEAKGFKEDFPFSASSVSLEPVEGGYEGYITPEADKALDAFAELIDGEKRVNPGTFATFCATTPEQFEACESNVENIYKKMEPGLEWTCHEEETVEACFNSIKTGTSQFMAVGPSDALNGHQSHSLSAIAAEAVNKTAVVYSMAVIDADACEETTFIADYEDRDICFPNFNGDAGWKTPLSVMITQGILSESNATTAPNNAAQSVSDYFGDVCAPHDREDPDIAPDDLCGGCPDDCESGGDFSGPLGSLECMRAADNAVGFTDSSLLLMTNDTSDLRIICPYKRGCHDVGSYRSCNWGETPTDMILLEDGADPAYVSILQSNLIAASLEDGYQSLLITTRANGELVALSGDTGLYLTPYISTEQTMNAFEEA